jgi:hypothetical protein
MMGVLRLLLRWATRVIYVVFGLTVLYFPAATLTERIARETRLFRFENIFPRYAVEDALLPGLALAFLYAANMAVRRRIEPVDAPEEDDSGRAIDNASRQQPEHE